MQQCCCPQIEPYRAFTKLQLENAAIAYDPIVFKYTHYMRNSFTVLSISLQDRAHKLHTSCVRSFGTQVSPMELAHPVEPVESFPGLDKAAWSG